MQRVLLVLPFLLVLALHAPTSVLAGSRVLIDLQESPTPDPSVVSSEYSGSGPTIYAFLVLKTDATNQATAINVAYSFSDAENLVNRGFTYLDGWQACGRGEYGFRPEPGDPVADSTVVIGYWTLDLPSGAQSHGILSLTAPEPPEMSHAAYRARRGILVPLERLEGAGINMTGPQAVTQTSSYRYHGDAGHRVVFMTSADPIVWPENVVGGDAVDIQIDDEDLASALRSRAGLLVERVFRRETGADSVYVLNDTLTVPRPPLWRVFAATLPDTAVSGLLSDLRQLSAIQFAEPDRIREPAFDPYDQHYADEWQLWSVGAWNRCGIGYSSIDANYAWDLTTGLTTTKLAILDDGIDHSHPDLQQRTITGDPEVGEHGTWVAGAAAAATDNGIGIAGVDWRCSVINQYTENTASDIAASIDEAVWYRYASAVNISLMGYNPSIAEKLAVCDAASKGVPIMAAAGNDGQNAPGYPASLTLATGIGGSTCSMERWGSSNYGPWLDFMAPGEEVFTTLQGGSYGPQSATSLATGLVSGVVSLMEGYVSPYELCGSDIREILKRSRKEMGSSGWDVETGWGLVSAQGAVNYLYNHTLLWRGTAGGNVDYGNTGWYNMPWYDPPFNDWNTGDYRVCRHEVRRTVPLSGYPAPVDAWGTDRGSRGYSPESPHEFMWPYTDVVSLNSSEVVLRTYVYEVTDVSGHPDYGWWPCTVDQAQMGVTVVFNAGATEVSEDSDGAGIGPLALRLTTAQPVSAVAEFEASGVPPGPCAVRVFDVQGRIVAARELFQAGRDGRMAIRWEGRDDHGHPAGSGIYWARIEDKDGRHSGCRLCILK